MIGLGGKVASIVPEIISLEVAAGLTTLPGAAGTGVVGTGGTASATATGKSNMTVTTATLTASSSGKATGVTTTATNEGAGSSSAQASSTSSTGAAQTNAVVAGIVGAVGFLGMALAL